MTSIRKWISLSAVTAVALAMGAVPAAAQPAPGAPTGLTYLVNGSAVSLQWTHSTGTFTHYVLEAGGAPGQTFFVFPTNVLVDPSKLPQLLASFNTAGVGAGTYYVRIRGANGAVLGEPSNEVALTIGGCQAPTAPTQFTAIVRGTTAYMMWNPGNGGAPAGYDLIARVGGVPVAVFPLGNTPYLNVGGVPPGTFDVTVRARNACGTSAESNSVQVIAGNNTPALTPGPAPGARLPQPFVRDLVLQVAADARARGLMDGSVSCPSRPGYADSDIEARKVNLNGYINFMVDSLRQVDQRFGYNAKPTRASLDAIVAGDEIAYHYGSDAPEGSPNVYVVDTLGGHCTFGRESADYRPFYNEFGRWTGAGRF